MFFGRGRSVHLETIFPEVSKLKKNLFPPQSEHWGGIFKQVPIGSYYMYLQILLKGSTPGGFEMFLKKKVPGLLKNIYYKKN